MTYRAQRLAALALLVIFFPGVAVATAYALRPVRASLPVYALDRHRHVLPPGSRLAPGEHVTVVATGFRAAASVQVVDTSRRRIAVVRADSRGVARHAFVAPAHRATHLSVALAGRAAADHPSRGASKSSTNKEDPQSVVVTVPLLRRFTYRLAGDSGVDAGGIGIDPGTHTGDGGGSGLADTGVDVLALLVGGALLVVLGTVACRAAGRRGRD